MTKQRNSELAAAAALLNRDGADVIGESVVCGGPGTVGMEAVVEMVVGGVVVSGRGGTSVDIVVSSVGIDGVGSVVLSVSGSMVDGGSVVVVVGATVVVVVAGVSGNKLSMVHSCAVCACRSNGWAQSGQMKHSNARPFRGGHNL